MQLSSSPTNHTTLSKVTLFFLSTEAACCPSQISSQAASLRMQALLMPNLHSLRRIVTAQISQLDLSLAHRSSFSTISERLHLPHHTGCNSDHLPGLCRPVSPIRTTSRHMHSKACSFQSRLFTSCNDNDNENDDTSSQLSAHEALTCPEGQCAWTLDHRCRRLRSWFSLRAVGVVCSRCVGVLLVVVGPLGCECLRFTKSLAMESHVTPSCAVMSQIMFLSKNHCGLLCLKIPGLIPFAIIRSFALCIARTV